MRSSKDWQALLEDEPDNELILFSLGKAYLDEKNFPQAEKAFQSLTDKFPDYALAWSYLARCKLQNGDREGARAACEKGLPVARAQKHETPEMEIQAVLDELDSEF